MKSTLTFLMLIATLRSVQAQYFYKDIIATQQTILQYKLLRASGVKEVKLSSFEADGTVTDGFSASQTLSPDYSTVTTDFSSPIAGASQVINTYNGSGQLIRTTDTTDGSGSVSEYFYNARGLLSKIVNLSTSGGQRREKEDHIWQYDDAGKPTMLYRVKNGIDTTFISFAFDDKGMVAEENGIRKGKKLPTVYYYYDDKNRLTDVAAYNDKAQRILPSYVFDYNAAGKMSSMIVVPEGSDQYQKWIYEYNAKGLKIRETAFDKKKQMQGKIEYRYQ
jgi:hypothetical protein